MTKHYPTILTGENCTKLEEDWLGPDPYGPATYECDFCGHDRASDDIREYVKDVDGSQGLICQRCVKLGVLDDYTKRGS